MVLVILNAETVVAVFSGPDPVIIAATSGIMKIYLLLYAVGNISQIAAAYFQAVEKNGLAILNGIGRIILFAAPFLIWLPTIFGVEGIWMAQPIADALAGILAIVLLVREYRKLRKLS